MKDDSHHFLTERKKDANLVDVLATIFSDTHCSNNNEERYINDVEVSVYMATRQPQLTNQHSLRVGGACNDLRKKVRMGSWAAEQRQREIQKTDRT